MTYSQTHIFAEILAGHHGPEIPAPARAYFQQRLRNRMFKFILEKFIVAQKSGLTQAVLARRIGKSPEVVSRWLGKPSNLTIDSMSDMLLGIAAEEMHPSASSFLRDAVSSYANPGGGKFDEFGAVQRATEGSGQVGFASALDSQTYRSHISAGAL